MGRIRCDNEYQGIWVDFMQQSTGSRASTIFYQYVTDKLFRKLVVSKHPVNNEHQGLHNYRMRRRMLFVMLLDTYAEQ